MFIYYFLITISYIVEFTKGQNLYITNPSSITFWKTNDFCTIEWSNSDNDIQFETVRIDLLQGDSNNAIFVSNIVTNLPGKSNSYIWTVSPNLKKSDDYFLKITGNTKTKTYVNYSVKFSITTTTTNVKKVDDNNNTNNTIFVSSANKTLNYNDNPPFGLKSIYIFMYMILNIAN